MMNQVAFLVREASSLATQPQLVSFAQHIQSTAKTALSLEKLASNVKKDSSLELMEAASIHYVHR